MTSVVDTRASAPARSSPFALAWAKFGDVVDAPMRAIQRHVGANRMAYVFLLPNLLIFGLFSFWPMILNVYISFTGGSSTLLAQRPFVGLQNFQELLACETIFVPRTCSVAGFSFWTGMWNTLLFALFQVPIMVLFALVTALVLNREIRARGFWRAIYFYPVMLSPVVVGIIWDWVLKRRGILNVLLAETTANWNAFLATPLAAPLGAGLGALAGFGLLALATGIAGRVAPLGAKIAICAIGAGLGAWLGATGAFAVEPYRPVNWLVETNSVWPMFWVVFVYTWAHVGFYMLILLAGLQAIPKDLYEAAAMDGTSKSRMFWRITLPLLMPTMLVVLVLSLIKAFQVFDEVYVLTGGGPGQATKMIIQHIYETAFTGDAKRYGVAAASSILVAGLILVLTLGQLALSRKKAG
jgi:ABC-type sugar transport system permease subunit